MRREIRNTLCGNDVPLSLVADSTFQCFVDIEHVVPLIALGSKTSWGGCCAYAVRVDRTKLIDASVGAWRTHPHAAIYVAATATYLRPG